MDNPDPRVTIAASVMVALQIEFPDSVVDLTQTTSGCPVVQVTTGDRTINLTVTIQRKSKP